MLTVRDSDWLGDAMSVTPVAAEGALSQTVALPPGRWVNWNSGLRYEEERSIEGAVPLETAPVLCVKGP